MITITRLLLIGCLLISARFQFTNGFQTANSTDDLTADCTICPTMELVSEGGFAEMYPRYLGVWGIVGYYHGLPYYRCGPDCEGLQDKLVFLKDEDHEVMGHWAIVDCTPEDAIFCAGVHETIRAPTIETGTTCPYGETVWQYCCGEHTQEGCTAYCDDPTLTLKCIN